MSSLCEILWAMRFQKERSASFGIKGWRSSGVRRGHICLLSVARAFSSKQGAALPKALKWNALMRSEVCSCAFGAWLVPRFARYEKRDEGKSPSSRSLRREREPIRLERGFPSESMRRGMWAKRGGEESRAWKICICTAVFATWSSPRMTWVTWV